MKINSKQLLFFYTAAICLITIYIVTSVKECEAYWMHDASITITKQKLFIDTSFLFLLPILIITIQVVLKITVPAKLFLIHFSIASASILFLFFAINKPCENINGGHYMFIDAAITIGYYLLKWISIIITGVIIIKTIALRNKITKTSS